MVALSSEESTISKIGNSTDLSPSTFSFLCVGVFVVSVVKSGESLLADCGLVVLCPAGIMLIGHSKRPEVWSCSSKISDFVLA